MQLKTEIAYPLIRDLISKLNNWSTGVYNGKSRDMYARIAIDFVQNFAQRSVNLYITHKMNRNGN